MWLVDGLLFLMKVLHEVALLLSKFIMSKRTRGTLLSKTAFLQTPLVQ